MQLVKGFAALLLAGSLIGCATGLNSFEKRELEKYDAMGLKIISKDEDMAAGLGILPGGGSFYVGEIGAGLGNLLLWPASIPWDMYSGYYGAQSANYAATKIRISHLKENELTKLNDQLATDEIDSKQYIIFRRKIELKYKAF